jgi:hypothetical protein
LASVPAHDCGAKSFGLNSGATQQMQGRMRAWLHSGEARSPHRGGRDLMAMARIDTIYG